MTQREQLERVKMILIALVEFLQIASEACQELACENGLAGRTVAENEFTDLLIEDGAPTPEGERYQP